MHWLELAKDEDGNEIPCWSLFYMGKKEKEWGFVRPVLAEDVPGWKDAGYRWISHQEYLKDRERNEYA